MLHMRSASDLATFMFWPIDFLLKKCSRGDESRGKHLRLQLTWNVQLWFPPRQSCGPCLIFCAIFVVPFCLWTIFCAEEFFVAAKSIVSYKKTCLFWRWVTLSRFIVLFKCRGRGMEFQSFSSIVFTLRSSVVIAALLLSQTMDCLILQSLSRSVL